MVKYDHAKTLREDVKPFKEEHLPALKAGLRWATKIAEGRPMATPCFSMP